MITAMHRIITDECRKQPDHTLFSLMYNELHQKLLDALQGYPAGEGTKIHIKVEIER